MMPVLRTSKHYQALDLSGQRVLITGATSGTGKACAFRFQELNCHLILVGRDQYKLQALGMELYEECQKNQSYGGKPQMPELIWLNVEDTDKIQELPGHVGHVDILINNAGTNLGGDPVNQVNTGDLNSMVFTNYVAPMAFVSAFGPHMKKKGTGHIINICSTAADDIYANGSVYCSTKAALAAYSVAARHDLVDTPIRVSSISPGLVDTPLHEKKMGHEKSRAVFDGIVPLSPEDVADQVIYIATRPYHVQVADLASYCTNQSHSGVKGISGVARMGKSLGAPQSQRPGDEFKDPEYSSQRRQPQDYQAWRSTGPTLGDVGPSAEYHFSNRSNNFQDSNPSYAPAMHHSYNNVSSDMPRNPTGQTPPGTRSGSRPGSRPTTPRDRPNFSQGPTMISPGYPVFH